MIMKNLVIGIIIGALLIFSGQAVAGSISKVGKKVQAEYQITVDGKTLEAKALAIDGQTTTPNRALAEAVGYDVAFVNKEVIFTKKVDTIIETSANPVVVPAEQNYTIDTITEAIKNLEGDMWADKVSLESFKNMGGTKNIDIMEASIAKQESELIRLKAIKAQLEAQQ
jgi:hypothetical protein